MFILTVCEDLYGYISEQYSSEGFSFRCETEEEAFKMAKYFMKKGFSVAIEKEKNKASDYIQKLEE